MEPVLCMGFIWPVKSCSLSFDSFNEAKVMTASRRVIKFSIGQHIGRYISGIAMPDGGVDWSFARKLGLGL